MSRCSPLILRRANLATDGYHEIPGFLSRLVDVQRHSNLETAAPTLLTEFHHQSGQDDGTVALIRRVDCPEDLRKVYLEAFEKEVGLPDSPLIGHLMQSIIIKEMIDWAGVPDPENLVQGLHYLKREKLNPDKKQAAAILENFKDDHSPEALLAYREISRLIINL